MNLTIHALIPARGGSKGIPKKNILLYKSEPLIVHSIKLAKESKYITDVIVTTDNDEISDVSKKANALVPFIRPIEISQDLSTDYEFCEHFLNWFDGKKMKNNIKYPDIIVQLRPTYPNRNIKLLDDCIETYIKNYKKYSSLRTVVPICKSAFKMYTISNYTLNPIVKSLPDIKEPYNRCRQELPVTYMHNGCIDIIKSSTITGQKSVTGDKILPYVMSEDEINDIDTIDDFQKSENK